MRPQQPWRPLDADSQKRLVLLLLASLWLHRPSLRSDGFRRVLVKPSPSLPRGRPQGRTQAPTPQMLCKWRAALRSVWFRKSEGDSPKPISRKAGELCLAFLWSPASSVISRRSPAAETRLQFLALPSSAQRRTISFWNSGAAEEAFGRDYNLREGEVRSESTYFEEGWVFKETVVSEPLGMCAAVTLSSITSDLKIT